MAHIFSPDFRFEKSAIPADKPDDQSQVTQIRKKAPAAAEAGTMSVHGRLGRVSYDLCVSESEETRENMDDPFAELRSHLSGLPSGTVQDPAKIESLLSRCWSEIEGSWQGGMTADKLLYRTEEMEWTPPFLSFLIARHGATVLGSASAELQGWKVNVDLGTATVAEGGKRVVGNRQARLDVEPMAEAIVALILAGTDDERLKWYGDSRVRILIGKIITDDSARKQTIAGRRKRLAKAIESKLMKHGWKKTGVHRYEKIRQG